jgi:hypothetical protein
MAPRHQRGQPLWYLRSDLRLFSWRSVSEVHRAPDQEFHQIRFLQGPQVVRFDLKIIYQAPLLKRGGLSMPGLLREDLGNQVSPHQVLAANWTEIATFFRYPPEIRKIIYTTVHHRGLPPTAKKSDQSHVHSPK